MMKTQKKIDPVLIRKFLVSIPMAINFAEWPSVSFKSKFVSKTDEISNKSRLTASVRYPRNIDGCVVNITLTKVR